MTVFAKHERALIDRRRKHVVYDQERNDGLGGDGQPDEVDDLERQVGGGLCLTR